jgi:hypothetical protein
VPTGQRIAVQQIHKIVENNWELTAEDKDSHPSEKKRNNKYPAWKRKVQAALHALKTKGKIQHFEDTQEYIFDSSSCC